MTLLRKISFKRLILSAIGFMVLLQSVVNIFVLPKIFDSGILQLIVSMIVFWAIEFIGIYFLTKNFFKVIESFERVVNEYAKGNFVYEIQDSKWSEFVGLFKHMGNLQGVLKGWVFQVIKSSCVLNDYSKDFVGTANRSAQAYDQMSTHLNGLVDKSTDMSDQISQSAAATEELSSSNSLVASASKEALDSAKEMHTFTQESIGVIQESIDSINDLSDLFQNSSENIGLLVQLLQHIEKMSDSITSIAEQTNLLSLNAAIEAARAGEAGRGFSVVANEVRNLAEDSGQAAKEINQLIAKIKEQADITVSNMNNGITKVGESQNIATQASGNLDKIDDKIEGLYELIKDISGNISEQSSSAEYVAQTTEEIAAFSQDTNEVALSIGSEVHQQSKYIQQNVAMAEGIGDVLSQLNNFTKQFDDTIGQQLIQLCHKLADAIAEGKVDNEVLKGIAENTGVSEFFISDAKGVTTLCNNPQGIGFAFKDDPGTQAYEFYQILKNPSLEVTQPIQKRDIDNQFFKFVGVTRKDGRGIIQAGLSVEDIQRFRGETALTQMKI